MIEVNNLSKRFGDVQALRGISFEIQPGQTFGLLGPNGAGKTTAIEIMCGLLAADGGTVSLDGQQDPMCPGVRRVLGLSPQSLALYEELNVQQNLAFFAKLYGIKGKQLTERVNACLEIAQLGNRRKHRVSTFSGGMKRRLNLACALLHEPRILLLDEPTVGVDPQSRNLIFDTIEQFKQAGTTIVYTTHYMEEAQRLCDKVAIMDHGKILDIDNVQALIQKHGGKSHVAIEFNNSVDDTGGVKAALGEDSLEIKDQSLCFQTDDPLEALGKLQKLDLDICSLKIDQANLEDVFLNLTGRRLRDK